MTTKLDTLRAEAAGILQAIKADEASDTQKARMSALRTEIEVEHARLKAIKDGEELLGLLNPAAKQDLKEVEAKVAASLGHHVAEVWKAKAAGFRAGGPSASLVAPEYHAKVAGDPLLTTGLTNPQVDNTVVEQPRRMPRIVSLLTQGTLTGNLLKYRAETAKQGAPATVAEGAKKPKVTYGFEEKSETPKKIAALANVSDEMLEDFGYLVTEVNTLMTRDLVLVEEDQVLNGDGTGSNLLGITKRAGVLTLGAAVDPAAGNLDQVLVMAMNIYNACFLTPDAVTINPTDAVKLAQMKDANGQYLLGGPAYAAYGNGSGNGVGSGGLRIPPIWGLEPIVTPLQAAGKITLGAFGSATFYRKGGIRSDASYENSTNFEDNLATLRVEERAALKVPYGSAFGVVTLGAA